MKSLFTLCGLLTACAVASAAGMAQAATRTAYVPIADLDMTTMEGNSILQRRIAAAERRVCPRPGWDELAKVPGHRACLATARAGVTRQLAGLMNREPGTSASRK